MFENFILTCQKQQITRMVSTTTPKFMLMLLMFDKWLLNFQPEMLIFINAKFVCVAKLIYGTFGHALTDFMWNDQEVSTKG